MTLPADLPALRERLRTLEDELRTLEERLLTPAVRHDRAALEDLLAPGFIEFGSSGRIFNREQILAELVRESPSTAELSLTDFRVLSSSDQWALVTYRSHPSGGSPALRSSTWVRPDPGASWQMLFHQGTRAAVWQPPGRQGE